MHGQASRPPSARPDAPDRAAFSFVGANPLPNDSTHVITWTTMTASICACTMPGVFESPGRCGTPAAPCPLPAGYAPCTICASAPKVSQDIQCEGQQHKTFIRLDQYDRAGRGVQMVIQAMAARRGFTDSQDPQCRGRPSSFWTEWLAPL